MARFRINWDLIKDIVFGIFTVGVWFLLKPKPGQRKSATREWIDAIIFAVIAATIIRTFLIEAYTIPTPSMEKSLLVDDFLFVSKVSYGARVPMTPLSFPFAHNTLPLVGGKSYLEWIKIGYHRLPGFGSVHRGDCVVFNWPAENEGRPVDKNPCRSRHNRVTTSLPMARASANRPFNDLACVRAASRSHRLNTVST
jgi:signal peptidase I